MTNVLPPASLGKLPAQGHLEMHSPLDGASRDVLDLALLAIDGLEGLSPTARLHEEEEVKALLDELDTDEQRMVELHMWLQAAVGTGQTRYKELAKLMGVTLPVAEHAEEVSGKEITRRLESQGYVKVAPKFSDQLNDESREGVRLQYDEQPFSDTRRGKNVYRTTELKGIRQLNGFLDRFITKSAHTSFKFARDSAKSIKEKLTYIGDKELDEGSAGFAHYWGEYLAQDEANQLCVVTTSSLRRYEAGTFKSDDFVRDGILERMSKLGVPAEAMRRIITDPRKISGDPKKIKIVFVDDWVVSGRQMANKIEAAMYVIGDEYRDGIEVNTLTAPPHFIKGGLGVGGASIPVKAYYQAHAAAAQVSEGVKCHITGTHSTVNFGFSIQVGNITDLLNSMQRSGPKGSGQSIKLPAVASIYRPYWGTN